MSSRPNAILRWTLLGAFLSGCSSPEDGRARGGGRGGDGGNYEGKPIHAPSKIDATRARPPGPLPGPAVR